MCVCVRERERERECVRGGERESVLPERDHGWVSGRTTEGTFVVESGASSVFGVPTHT